jgi:hypothetical protein
VSPGVASDRAALGIRDRRHGGAGEQGDGEQA